MKTIFLFLIVSLAIFACSKEGPEPRCFQDQNLDIVATITNVKGTVRGPESDFCEGDFVIQLDEKVERRPLGFVLSVQPCQGV